MDFSRFFIDRPIFAAVLSIVIFAAGLIAIPMLPIGEYPEVVPPSVVVRTVYPGANPKVIAETVATPLEEAINGVEDMMYVKSVAGSDGVLQMTVTFKPGVDADDAAVRVQNRVSQALARLPEDVRRQGVTTQKQSPVFLMVVHLVSTDGKYDSLYLRNYARLHVKDEMAKHPGRRRCAGLRRRRLRHAPVAGSGQGRLARPDRQRRAARGARAERAGLRRPARRRTDAQRQRLPAADQRQGPPAARTEEFGNIVLKAGADGEIVRLSDVARIELAAGDYTLRARLDGMNASAIGIFQAPGANALEIRDAVVAKMDEISKTLPPGVEIKSVYDTTIFVRDSIKAVITTLLEATLLVVLVVILFLQTWRASIIPLIAVPVSIVGTFGVLYLLGFSINTLTLFGLVLAIGIVVDDAIVVVENVERNIEEGLTPLAAAHQAMREVSGPIIAIALVLCAVFVPMAFLSGRDRPVLQAVRGDHRHLHGDLGDQLADPVAGAGGLAAEAARRGQGCAVAADRPSVRLAVPSVQPLLQARFAALRRRGVACAGPARRGVRGLRRAADRRGRDVQGGAGAASSRCRTSCT